MSFICRICDRTFDAIPEDATALGRGRGIGHTRYVMFLFPDRFVHDDLRPIDPPTSTEPEKQAPVPVDVLLQPTPTPEAAPELPSIVILFRTLWATVRSQKRVCLAHFAS
jgi:hypothetical protein